MNWIAFFEQLITNVSNGIIIGLIVWYITREKA